MCVCSHIQVHAYIYIHTHIHVYTYVHTHAYIHAQAHIYLKNHGFTSSSISSPSPKGALSPPTILYLYVPSFRQNPGSPKYWHIYSLTAVVYPGWFQNYFIHTTTINTPTKKEFRFCVWFPSNSTSLPKTEDRYLKSNTLLLCCLDWCLFMPFLVCDEYGVHLKYTQTH